VVWDRLDPEVLACEARSRTSRRPLQPRTGDHLPVLFGRGTAGVLFHELVGHLLEGDIVASGSSPLGDIGSRGPWPPSLRIVDDPSRFDLPGAFTTDDEGVAAQPVVLIEDGRVVGPLCDRATAALLGHPAGRGRRASWSVAPVPRLSNLVVAPGLCPVDDLRSGIRAGLEISSLSGASVDPETGRVVVRVESGWEIRNGRRRRDLARCELTGTVHQVLGDIAPDIGNDPLSDSRLGWCVKDGQPLPTGSEAPSLLVQRMRVL
jgi:TldD protein